MSRIPNLIGAIFFIGVGKHMLKNADVKVDAVLDKVVPYVTTENYMKIKNTSVYMAKCHNGIKMTTLASFNEQHLREKINKYTEKYEKCKCTSIAEI